MPLVGWILILMGLFSVGAVLFAVVREHQEPEEAYTPPPPGSTSEPKQSEGSGE